MNASEPRAMSPGIGRYVSRTMGIAFFPALVLFFAAVHFYHSTSALLDILADFILFLYLFFLGLSLTCLVLCARAGPGDLPSRFSAARMETFIRCELQRVVEKARAAHGAGSDTATAVNGTSTLNVTTTKASSSSLALEAENKKHWDNLDDEEGHQLANLASTAALTQRISPAATEAEMEKRAVEARLLVHESRSHFSSNDDADAEEQQHRHHHPHAQEDDTSLHNSADDGEEEGEVRELPAYMTEMMQLRRHRKIRRGLEIVRVSEAAQKLLQAMDSDDFDRKREEMSYLIPGANWCRFCSFYQMNDTRHCTVCGRCVYRTKLHSTSCGNCIGYANSKYYVLFQFYLIVAFLMGNFLDLYCITNGYTFFFRETGESNSIYYLVFVYSYAIVVVQVTLLIQYLLAAGRNVGLQTELLREQREELEAVRLRNSGEQYQILMSERTAGTHDEGNSSPAQPREPFSWQRAMNTVGEGLPLPLWFWPVPTRPAVNEMADPEGFWENLKEAIRIRLRSVADEDDAFTDEDDVDMVALSNAGNGFSEEHSQRGACPFVCAAAAVAPPVPVAPSTMPHRARATDVVMESVVVPVPTLDVPNAQVETMEPTVELAGSRAAAAMSPAPPIAMAAPAPRKKVD